MNEWLSLLSFYMYDDTIFDSIELPEQLDKETFINNLLLECSELEIMYSDVDFLKQALTFWSKSRIHAWQKMANALYTEYDPFISMERYEERVTHADTEQDTTSTSAMTGNEKGKTETYTNAWNSTADTKRETVNNNLDSTNDVNGTSNTKGSNDVTDKFSSKGDSALYTKQEILKQEIDTRNKYNLYNYIINDFKKKFCILVY